ncbi:MAG: CHASE3 domain-containing protein [Hydrococcus sp. Prado102]|jgi:signal transduction histidine kinase|nr:CHASE3 domain-containing protein [Hydrococcus sp. Prado102]
MLLHIAQSVFKRRLFQTIALPIVLLLGLSGISIWQIVRLLDAMQWVDNTDKVIAEANKTQKLLLDLETGGRGYLLSGELEFLEPFNNAIAHINPSFRNLESLIADNPTQGNQLAKIETLYQQWNSYTPPLMDLIAEERSNLLATLKVRKQLMDEIRAEISAFIATEEQLRNKRSQIVRQTTQFVIGSTIVWAIAIGGILAYFTRYQLLEISQSYEDTLKKTQQQTETIERSSRRLNTLHQIDREILSAQSIEKLAQDILANLINSRSDCQGAIVLCDVENGSRILAGDPTHSVVSINDNREPTSYIPDIAALNARTARLETLLSRGYRSFLSIAMHVENRHIGELNLFASQPDAFNSQDREIAYEVANQLAIAIQQSQLRSQVRDYALELEQRVQQRTKQLEEANQELEAFSYSVSHDLRAPLRAIEGFAQILLDDYSDRLDELGQEYAHRIVEAASRLDRLILDLLAYSRLGRTEIQLQPVDLSVIINEVLSELELKETDARVDVKLPLFIAIAHRSVLKQVVTNILTNAIKFVSASVKPQIFIWAEKRGDYVRLWVEDNGIGIAPQHQQRIFKPFERLHGIETYPGTGIGLAIVQRGIERMGGQVGVESSLQQGSRFWIELKSVTSYQ